MSITDTGTGPANTGGEHDDLAETIVARLARRLRDDILSGRLQFGARLRLRELSERFGVSQMPIRDALVKLGAEGLVELQPNRGASVRKIDRTFIENMFDVRTALEEMLVRRCIERSSELELASLRPIAERHARAVEQHDIGEIFAANSLFHRRITALARNGEATRILEQGWELIHAIRGQAGYSPARLLEIVDEHMGLVRSIEARDAEAAGRIARQHVERSRDDVLLHFER